MFHNFDVIFQEQNKQCVKVCSLGLFVYLLSKNLFIFHVHESRILYILGTVAVDS